MSYRVRQRSGQAVVTMPADIDVTSIQEVRRALLAAVGESTGVLIIDMGGTRFCDSSGVQAIIDAHRRATATRTQLRLVATAVTRILTLTGVDQLIPIYPTLEAALAGGPAAQEGTGETGGEAASTDLG